MGPGREGGVGYQFELSAAALDILAEQLGFSATRYPFEVRSVGITLDERAGIRDAVWRQLDSAGLVRGERLEPEVEQALRLYGQSPVEASLIGSGQDGLRLKARAGATRDGAVIAFGAGETVRFELLRPGDVAPALVRLMPAAPPGSGEAVTIPLDGAPRVDSAEERQTMLISGRPSAAQASMRVARELFARPRLRVGQFGVAMAGQPGQVLPWFDTEAGRYLAVRGQDSTGREQVTYTPTDGTRLVRELAQRLSFTSTR
ncbi:MAG: hypothetical protein GEU98_29530 [Pseudonocardiaceae bacterium]|nr:hypothetical protein [Pseudonocardiaceae bacterium]